MKEFDYSSWLYCAKTAESLALAPLWKQYVACVAFRAFGSDTASCDKLINMDIWPEGDPLKKASVPREALVQAQSDVSLPLADEERRTFIKKEHGRLKSVIGIDWWDENNKQTNYFHQRIEEGTEDEHPTNPYDISFEELAALPDLEKRVERIGTYSYMRIFRMFPEDSGRLKFLAGIWKKLTHSEPCTPAEMGKLLGGHDEYLEWKLADAVLVIAPGKN